MHSFLNLLFGKTRTRESNPPDDSPPPWAPALGTPHERGKYSDATSDKYEEAEKFCNRFPVDRPVLLSSDIVTRLSEEGCKLWKMEPPQSLWFRGTVECGTDKKSPAGVTKVVTRGECKETCIFSNLPIMAGLYDTSGKGVYYEVVIKEMRGIIAIGSACLPYPDWRFPGWNRLSAGFHLDDFRIFFEDPDGGRDYVTHGLPKKISPGNSIGFGYEFATNSVFFTYNGTKLSTAFTGIYVPRQHHDVYAAIGVEGPNDFEVNFGAEVFMWKEGNDRAWKVEAHVGVMAGSSGSGGEDPPPSYQQSLRV